MYIALHNHSVYSLLDSIIKINDLIEKAVQLGHTAVALTDHGNLFGAVKFYDCCLQWGIKPILGEEFYIADNSFIKSERYHITLLCKNDIGWRNLMKLSSLSWERERFYYKPRIDKNLLQKHKEGIICLSGCLGSKMNTFILREDWQIVKEEFFFFKELFQDDFYLEMIFLGTEDSNRVNDFLKKLGRKYGVKLVATNDAHYLDSKDEEYHKYLLMMQRNIDVEKDDASFKCYKGLYFRNNEEMQKLLQDYGFSDVLMFNTLEIAEKVDIINIDRTYKIPNFILRGEDYVSSK